jgi:hypothetical protein
MLPGLVRLWGVGSYTVTVPANCTTAVVGLWAPGSNGINGNTTKGQNGGSSGDLRPGRVARHADWSSHGHAWPDALRQHRGRVHRDRGVRVLRRGVHGDDLHQRDGRHGPASAHGRVLRFGTTVRSARRRGWRRRGDRGSCGRWGRSAGHSGADHQGGAGTASDTGGRRGVVRVRAAGAPAGLLRGFCGMPIDYGFSSFHDSTRSRGVPKGAETARSRTL